MGVPNVSILKMNDRDTITFVELYENEPLLWNPTDPKYHNKDARNAAAQRIVVQLNIQNFTAKHVFVKFKNLRSSYLQEVKKINESYKSGCSTDDVYIPKVVWFTTMDRFLKPHVKSRKTHSNLSDTQSQDTLDIQDTQKTQNTQDTQDDIKIVDSQDTQTQGIPQDMVASTSAHDDIMVLSSRNITSQTLESLTQVNKGKKQQPPNKLTNDNNKTKKSKATPNNVTPSTNANIDKALEKLDEISSRAHASLANQNREDHLDNFGKYIVSMLRNVSPRKSLSLQKDIISLLFEAQMPPPSLSTTEDDSCSDYPGRPPSSDTNASTSVTPASPLPSCSRYMEDFDYLLTRL